MLGKKGTPLGLPSLEYRTFLNAINDERTTPETQLLPKTAGNDMAAAARHELVWMPFDKLLRTGTKFSSD